MIRQIITQSRPISRRASLVPGDTIRELTRPLVDIDGQTWPAGTRYQPVSAGNDGYTIALVDEREPGVHSEIVEEDA